MRTVKQTTALLIVIVFTTVLFSQAVFAATQKERFDKLSGEILELIQSFYPVQSTMMGIHSYDHRLGDFSAASVKSMVRKLKDYEVKLHKINTSSFSLEDRTNYRLIKSNLDIALLNLDKIEWQRFSPGLYVDEAVNGVYYLELSQHAPMSEKLYSIIDRMKAVPDLFETARENLRQVPPVYIETAGRSLQSGMDFYRQIASEMMAEFPDRADEILKVSTVAREAMNDFLNYLSQVTPGDEKGFAIGKKNFDYMLSNDYFLDYDSDSLLKIGEQMLAGVQQEYDEQEQYLAANQNGQDSVFVPQCFSREDLIDYYGWEIDQVKLFLTENEIVSIPEDIAPLEVVETPPFLSTMITSIAYEPAGPFDDTQRGLIYIRPIPQNMDRRQLEARFRYVDRRGFRGSVVHEGYPGHHLQMQIAARNASAVRRWQTNPMMIEGWGLYCEELMYNDGLYGADDPAQRLKVLGGIRMRAARVIADVKLHTGQFTVDQCVDWMTDVLGIDTESGRQFIAGEVRRYTLTPTYQMSYLMGKRDIDRLRQAMEEREGENFSEQQFHDALLAEGSIPTALMWDLLGLSRPH